MDIVDKQTRSRMMASVRSKNTQIEVEIRKRLFAMGYRFRLHANYLPGKPDIVFPKYSAVILVNGCFWHMHGCGRSKLPTTRKKWWVAKLKENRQRDIKTTSSLKALGWRTMIIWECAVRSTGADRIQALNNVANRAAKFLESEDMFSEIPELTTSINKVK